MAVMHFDDEPSNEMQAKSNQLRDLTDMDVATQVKLWKETVHYRRKEVRDQSTVDILKKFPGYTNSVLVSQFINLFR